MSLVLEFHEAVNNQSNLVVTGPSLRPDPVVIRTRMRLIREEFKEVMDELTALTKPVAQDPQRHVEILRDLLKELADLRYVVEGTAVTLGLPFEAAFVEVHRSNMSKFGEDGLPIMNDFGKVLKGPNYSPADLTGLVPDIITITEVEDHAADDS